MTFPMFKTLFNCFKHLEMEINQRRTKNMKGKKVRKTLTALGVGLLFGVGFMFLGMFIDIQIISKSDYAQFNLPSHFSSLEH